MEYIARYLDELFDRLPQTEQLQQEKQRMLTVAQKEYSSLRTQGVSEQAAVDRIINGFRSIDDLARQFTAADTAPKNGTIPVLDTRMAEDCIQSGKSAAFLQAGGVGLIMVGAALQNFADFFGSFFGTVIGEMVENVSSFGFLGLIVAAILCFAQAKKKRHAFDFLNAGCYLAPDGRQRLEGFLNTGFDAQKALIVGILLCVAAAMISGVLEAIPLFWMDAIADTLMLLTASAGVFVLVFRAAMQKLMKRLRNLLDRGK